MRQKLLTLDSLIMTRRTWKRKNRKAFPSKMTMNRLLTILIFNFLISNQVSFSQMRHDEIINLHSLENKEVHVRIEFDYVNDRINLELNPNTQMIIKGFRYLSKDINIISQKFIELQIGMRGGSRVSVHRYVLLCISGGKIYKSIDLISQVKNLVDGSTECQVNFTKLIEKDKSYELFATGEPPFHFDSDNKIFYNEIENLSGSYLVASDETLNERIDFNDEKYPSVCVNQNRKYIFFRGKWFEIIQQNHLQETEFGLD
jgi:hypothetical protein